MTNQWNRSSVMRDFEKIAAENKLLQTDLNPDNKDFVGNPSTPTPVKDHRRYEPTEEYTKVKDSLKDLLNKAHPKTIETVKSDGAGGVVENIMEQQEKDIEERLRREVIETENYVKGPEKYGPQLGEHRWGFLPVVIQKFLHEVNEDCQVSKTNTNIKDRKEVIKAFN